MPQAEQRELPGRTTNRGPRSNATRGRLRPGRRIGPGHRRHPRPGQIARTGREPARSGMLGKRSWEPAATRPGLSARRAPTATGLRPDTGGSRPQAHSGIGVGRYMPQRCPTWCFPHLRRNCCLCTPQTGRLPRSPGPGLSRRSGLIPVHNGIWSRRSVISLTRRCSRSTRAPARSWACAGRRILPAALAAGIGGVEGVLGRGHPVVRGIEPVMPA